MPKGILESQVGMASDASLLWLAAQISLLISFLGVCGAYDQILPV